jgi:hypothetical protein
MTEPSERTARGLAEIIMRHVRAVFRRWYASLSNGWDAPSLPCT